MHDGPAGLRRARSESWTAPAYVSRSGTNSTRHTGRAPMDSSGTPAQIGWFAAIGTASAASYALLYLVFRYFLAPAWANALALATTAVVNTAANRRLTFKIRGTQGALRHHVQGFSVFVVGLAVTLGALRVLHLLQLGDNALIEVLTLTGANLCVTVARFVLMRSWIFRPPPR